MKRSSAKSSQPKLAVLCSGSGTNLQALLNAEKKGTLGGEIALVVCDKPDAYAIVRANKAKKPVALLESKAFKTRQAFEKSLVTLLRKAGVKYIVLAGFMRILTDVFINAFKNRILNIHPSLLPSFKGAHAIKDAYTHGVKTTGVTVHIASAELDNGPIIAQSAVDIKEGESLKGLEERIHKVEHKIYPKAVRLFVSGKVRIRGRKASIKN